MRWFALERVLRIMVTALGMAGAHVPGLWDGAIRSRTCRDHVDFVVFRCPVINRGTTTRATNATPTSYKIWINPRRVPSIK